MNFRVEFTDKEITSWGGMELIKRFLLVTGIDKKLSMMDTLPPQGSNRGYSPLQLILSFWISIWCGGNRYMHLEVLRQDKVLQHLFHWKAMAGYKAYQRYFGKFTQAVNQRVFDDLYSWFFDRLQFDRYTLDFDSTIMTRYGQQQGAKKGYNPRKPGRNSHHPLLAFVADCRMIANFWLRPGNSSAAGNFEAFLSDTLNKLRNKSVGLIRMDSGFYDKNILQLLENKGLNYIITAVMYYPLQRALASHVTWLKLSEGVEIAEFDYQADSWVKPRRIVAVRQKIADRPQSTGKQLSLFEEDYVIGQYRYSAYVTNLDLPAKIVWDSYRGRADSENRIKELKEDFGVDSFATQDFFALEATLNFVMMAYNLMSLFRQVVLKANPQPQLKTLRYKIFATAGYITKNGNSRILHLAVSMKNRTWWSGLFSSIPGLGPPYEFQNAKF
jgi:hypothetical protein